MAYLSDIFTPTADSIDTQLKQDAKIKGISRALRGLGLMNLEDHPSIGLSNLKVSLKDNPAQVLTGLQKLGRTPDTETLVRSLKPNIDEAGLNTLFNLPAAPNPPPMVSGDVTGAVNPFPKNTVAGKPFQPTTQPIKDLKLFNTENQVNGTPIKGLGAVATFKENGVEVRKAVTFDPNTQNAYDQQGKWVGKFNPVDKTIIPTTPESKIKDVWDSFRIGLSSAGKDTKNFFGTLVPQQIAQLSIANEIQNMTPGQIMNGGVEKAKAAYAPVIAKAQSNYVKNNQDFADFQAQHPELQPRPEWQQGAQVGLTKDPWGYVGYQIASNAPSMLAGMGVGLGATALTGNPLFGAAAAAAALTPQVSQQLYDDLIRSGATSEQATTLAGIVGPVIGSIEMVGEIPVINSVAPQIMAIFRKEISQELTRLTLRELTKRGIVNATKIELSEVAEEVLQQAIQNATVKVIDNKRQLSEGLSETAIQTALATLPMALAGGAMSNASQTITTGSEAVRSAITSAQLEPQRGSTPINPFEGNRPEDLQKAEVAKPLPGQITLDEQIAQKQYELQQAESVARRPDVELQNLKDKIASDPIANYKFTMGGKRVGLDSLISIREGQFPEYLTIKQAKAIHPNQDYSRYAQKGTPQYNHIPKDSVLDTIDFGDDIQRSPDEIAQAINQIRIDRATLRELQSGKIVDNSAEINALQKEVSALEKQSASAGGVGSAISSTTQPPAIEPTTTSGAVPPPQPPTTTSGAIPPSQPPIVSSGSGAGRVMAGNVPKRSPVQKVREFYKAKIADIKVTTASKALSLKDWTDYTLEQRDALYKENLAAIKAATQDKVASLEDWHKFSMEQQYKTLTDSFNAKIADLQGVNADKIASLKDWAKYTIEEKQRVAGILTDYIQEKLPLRERGKLIDAVKNVKDQAGLDEVIARVDTMAEESAVRTLKVKIESTLKKTIPKKQGAILKSKYTAEEQSILNYIRTHLNDDRAVIETKIQDNLTKITAGAPDATILAKENELLALTGIGGMDSTQLSDLLDFIQTEKAVGLAERLQQRAEIKTRKDANAILVTREITGASKGGGLDTGVIPGRESFAKGSEAKPDSKINLNYNRNLETLFDLVTGKSGKKLQDTVLSKFYNENVHNPYLNEEMARNADFTTFNAKAKELLGANSDSELSKILGKMETDKIKLTGKTTDGTEIDLEFTPNELISFYQWMQDPTLDKTFAEGMKWSPELKQTITDAITPEQKALADWMRGYLKTIWEKANPIYRQRYGIDLTNNPNYWPGNRDFLATDDEIALTFQDLKDYALRLPSAIKARTKNIIPLKPTDAIKAFNHHIITMESWINRSEGNQNLKDLLANKDIRLAIEQQYGKRVLAEIDHNVQVIVDNGDKTAKTYHILDTLRGNFSVAVLANPKQFVNQIPTVLLGLTEMNPVTLARGVADFWSNPVANLQELMTEHPYIIVRYKAGNIERDMKAALASGNTKFKNTLFTPMMLGDKFGTIQSYWAKYQEGLSNGLSKEEAMTEAGRMSDRIQNTGAAHTLTSLQNAGSVGKALTAYQSQPNKYWQILDRNIRNLKEGRGSKAQAWLAIAMVTVVMAAIFNATSGGLNVKRDLDRLKKANALGKVGILAQDYNPLNNLLVIGQLIQAIESKLSGDNYQYQAAPVLSIPTESIQALGTGMSIANKVTNPDQAPTADDWIKLAEQVGKPVGELMGLPIPYAIQLEKAARGTPATNARGKPTGETKRDWRGLIYSQYALRDEPVPFDVAQKALSEVMANIGQKDQIGLDAALKQAKTDKASPSKVAEINAKPSWLYDSQSVKRDMSAIISKLTDQEIAKLGPMAVSVSEYLKQKAEYEKLSDEEQKVHIKNNPDFTLNKILWEGNTTIPDLKTAQGLSVIADKYGIKLTDIPAFQLTDKGKERIPTDKTLWPAYFDYNALPGSGGYLSYSKGQVDAGLLPEKYLNDWQIFQKLKTDVAKSAFRESHRDASEDKRETLRRKNIDFSKWAEEKSNMGQDGGGLKPLQTKTSARRTTSGGSIRLASASSSGLSGGSVRPRSGNVKLPSFKQPSVRRGMRIGAPRVARV